MTDPTSYVLVIEDVAGIREALAETLADEGVAVQTASNGLEALTLLGASATPPCLILLDLMMPVMDGFEFREAQQGDPRLAAVPVVLLSADGTVLAKATSMGVAGALRKPVDINDLLAVIEQYRS